MQDEVNLEDIVFTAAQRGEISSIGNCLPAEMQLKLFQDWWAQLPGKS